MLFALKFVFALCLSKQEKSERLTLAFLLSGNVLADKPLNIPGLIAYLVKPLNNILLRTDHKSNIEIDGICLEPTLLSRFFTFGHFCSSFYFRHKLMIDRTKAIANKMPLITRRI